MRLYFPTLETWIVQSVSHPSCSSLFICTQMWDHLFHQLPPCPASSLPWLPISAPPPGLNECFFFNSLVFGLPYYSIFWQFWLFFTFKFVAVLLLTVWGGKVYVPTPPSWLVVSSSYYLNNKQKSTAQVRMRTSTVTCMYLLSFQGKSKPLLASADVTTILNLVFITVCFLWYIFITFSTFIPKKYYFILFSFFLFLLLFNYSCLPFLPIYFIVFLSQISWGTFYKQKIITHLNYKILWVLTNINPCVNSTAVKIKSNSIHPIYILMALCSQPFPTPHLGNHWSIFVPYNFAFYRRSHNWNHILCSI